MTPFELEEDQLLAALVRGKEVIWTCGPKTSISAAWRNLTIDFNSHSFERTQVELEARWQELKNEHSEVWEKYAEERWQGATEPTWHCWKLLKFLRVYLRVLCRGER